MIVLVAPARFVFTAAHIRHGTEDRTLCGKSLAEDELWTVVQPDPEVPVCRACQHVAQRAAERARSAQEPPAAPGPCQEVPGAAEPAQDGTAPCCCPLHGRNCEPPSELCCERCTEAGHPAHTRLGPCSAPDLSAETLLNSATVAEDYRDEKWEDATT